VKLRKLITLAMITVLVTLLCGCADSIPEAGGGTPSPTGSPLPGKEPGLPAGSGPSASIIVTRGFAEPAILEEAVALDGDTTALDALQTAASIETKYGGGFVSSIEGIASQEGDNEDWFFFVNGISLSTGADGYTLRDGDIEHWDYHDWGFRQFIPAIIGDFPEPFLHGIRGSVYPTVVTYQDGWEEEAREIADRLGGLGVSDITCQTFSDLASGDKEAANLILLGDSEFEPIGELNEVWDRLGFYGHFEDGSLRVFGPSGDLINEYHGNAGIIQATQSTWNPKGTGAGENVVWMVTGLDEAGVRAAVDTIADNHDVFRYACAVVIAGGEIIRVPR
jgi:hypothetical protein